ncbi:PilZ domain-containing protein [bacterium]|nr:PilZ domain-containing protein [bacterium]
MTEEQFRGETGAERRRFERKTIKLQVSYRCLDRGNISNDKTNLAEDLGAGGLLMHSKHALEKDQILMLTLFLPPAEERDKGDLTKDIPKEESNAVEILSRVAWSAPAKTGSHMVGIQFLDLDQNNRKWLKEFLVDFSLDQPDSPLYT